MRDVEKLEKLNIKVAVMKEQSTGKVKYSKQEKENLKKGIVEVCEALAEVLSDDTLDAEFKERLANETRKQMVLINKTLNDLQRIIRVSKSMLE